MRPGLDIQIEDKSDMFRKFSLLKDEDIRYTYPTQLSINEMKGVVYTDEREYRERELRKTI